MRGLARLVLINAAVFVALFAVAAIVFVLIPERGAEDTRTGRAALPNYDASPWITTYFKESGDLSLVYYSYLGWRRAPFAGETVNILAPYGERLTARADTPKPQTVFFFGGSTIWGTGSRDVDTIPSQFALATGLTARNFGETAYTAHQNLEMMVKLLQGGERPSAIVFYDGVNDVVHKCRRELTYYSDAREARTRLALEPSVLYRGIGGIVGKLSGLFSEAQIDEGYDCDSDPAKAAAIAEAMVSDWKIAAAAAGIYGIPFVAVLQPVVYYSHTRTDYLGIDMDDELSRQYRAVYPRLRELIAGLPFARDLTDTFDRDEALYIDFCHVSPNGNALMAERLAPLVAASLPAGNGS